MPDCDDDTITAIEKQLGSIEPVSKMIEKGYTPEQILEAVLGEGNVQVLSTLPVKFQCQCSKERFGAAIIGLGIEEIEAMIKEDGQAEAQCHFCLEKYEFNQAELEGLIDEIKG